MILEFVRFWKVRSRMRFRLLENEGQNRHVSSGIRRFCVRLKVDLNRALRARGSVRSVPNPVFILIFAYLSP